MGSQFKKVVGWEKFGGEVFLRVELNKPRISAVWPGDPSLEKPEAQLRRLTDMVMTRDDIYALITDPIEAADSGLSGDDLKMLSRALEEYPRKERPASSKKTSGSVVQNSSQPGTAV
jgi:hypothetical protein